MTVHTKGEPIRRCFFLIDLTTYAFLRKQITTAASGISDVRAEGDELVFVLADGREVRVAVPATGIRNAHMRDGALVLTLADGQEFVYRPPAAPTFFVVDEILQITCEEEVVPT